MGPSKGDLFQTLKNNKGEIRGNKSDNINNIKYVLLQSQSQLFTSTRSQAIW